jgi:hypothetical protein
MRYFYQQLQADGGSGSYVWSITSGSLPPGLVLDPHTGVIRGRPRLNMSSAFTVTAADANDAALTDSQDLAIIVGLHF